MMTFEPGFVLTSGLVSVSGRDGFVIEREGWVSTGDIIRGCGIAGELVLYVVDGE